MKSFPSDNKHRYAYNDAYYDLGYIDGYAKITNATSISYIYHQHVDANGNSISDTATSSTKGGCLTKGSHVHSANCQGICTMTATCTDSYQGDSGKWCNTYTYVHSSCGQGTTSSSSWQTYSRKGNTYTQTHGYYRCGNNPINTYSIGCGKSSSTIESATINFQ